MEYNQEEQNKGAEEYGFLPPQSKQFIDDYSLTRDSIRLCIGELSTDIVEVPKYH